MKKFMVSIPFVGRATMEIVAETQEQALEIALDTELTSDNIDSCTVGDHFEIDGFDEFASVLEMAGFCDLSSGDRS